MRRKPRLVLAAKLLFSGLLLWLVLRKVDAVAIMAQLRTADIRWLIPSFVLVPLVIFLSARRWQVLSFGLLGFGEAVRYTWIGLFFGSVVPGVVGGDVAKGVSLAAKTAQVRDPRLPVSIVVDKLVGFWVLLVGFDLAAFMTLIREPGLLQSLRAAIWIASGATAIGLGAAGAVCSRRGAALLAQLANKLPSAAVRSRTAQAMGAFGGYLEQRGALSQAALLSVAIHGVNALAFWLALRALAIPASVWFASLFYPLLSVLLAIPISVSGVGIRDVFAASMFTAFGLNPESGVAFSWLLLALTIPNVLVGGVVQLWEMFRRRSAD